MRLLPKRQAFAKHFAQLMLEGVSVVAKSPGRWTDGKLASALTEAVGRKIEHEFAPNTVGNWRKGKTLPDSIAPLIIVFFGEADACAAERQRFQDLFSEARLEKWGPLEVKATDHVAPKFIRRGKAHVIDRTPRETDARAAQNEKVQALQTNVRRSAERLAENVEARGTRYSNTPIWRELAKESRRLANIAALDSRDFVAKLPDAYDSSLYLGGRLDLDDRIIHKQSEDPPLDLDVRGDLVHLVRLAAPWLRSYPSIRKLDDQAARNLTDFGQTQSALSLIETATRTEAILPEDAEAMRTLGEAAEDPEFLGRKARRRFVGGAGNLALALAHTEADRQAHTLDLSNAETRALVEATRATLVTAGLEIDRLPLPDDVRAALRALVADAQASQVAPPSDNVEAHALTLILKGIAPPKAWRPWIRHLNLSDTDLTDVAPLAGLTALTSLNLNGTRVIDTAPLAGLTALTSLYLRHTPIADAAPLASLTTLTSLDLSHTPIADAAPLAGLTALTWLDLKGTRAIDTAPLALPGQVLKKSV